MTEVRCATCKAPMEPGETCHGHTRAELAQPPEAKPSAWDHWCLDCETRSTVDWQTDCTACGSANNLESCDNVQALWGHEWVLVAWASIASSHWGVPPEVIMAHLLSDDPGRRRAVH